MSARTESLPVQPRRSRPSLEVVRRDARSRWRRWAPAAAGIALLVGGVIVGVLLEQVVLAQSAFKLAGLRTELVASESQHEELLLEAAKMGSPDRIETHARAVLGMVDPINVRYIVANVYGTRMRPKHSPVERPLTTDPGVTAAVGSGP
jgi:hypothetical protein